MWCVGFQTVSQAAGLSPSVDIKKRATVSVMCRILQLRDIYPIGASCAVVEPLTIGVVPGLRGDRLARSPVVINGGGEREKSRNGIFARVTKTINVSTGFGSVGEDAVILILFRYSI